MHISPSNKKYIGITCQRPIKRWQHGRGYINNKHLYRAITKYTWESFEHIIIAKNLSKDEAKAMEISLIAKYNTQDGNFGYNISAGGDLPTTSMRINCVKSRSRPVFQFNLFGEFIASYSSISDAARAVGAKKSSNISSVALGKRAFAKGYLWSYTKDYVFIPDYSPREHIVETNIKQRKRVKAVSIDGQTTLTFDSLHDADKQTGCSFKNISACCHHRKQTAGGYIWSFVDEDTKLCA